jgi:hypothetical protein
MDTATTQAVPKTYIAEWIKLDFFNNSNLKTDIQNRISVNIEATFLNALNDMRGDNKNGYGISFSEITRLALAYFYSEIFTDKIKDNYYTLEMVKGFLDANNLTTYTAIHEINVPFYALKDAPLFKHCWLIVQSAWFFNSEYFGHHQHIDYVNHYINTGGKLVIENYKYDPDYLLKKYDDIDSKKRQKVPINGFTLVNQWYFGILFLICKELQLSTKHFNISDIDNRQYNPLPKTSRQLRPLAPFKVVECDIKSAFPTFLDIETGANLKDYVYNNLMQAKGITRSEAKILFNTVCNSSKYKSKEFTTAFFLDCGYSQKECEILLSLTHDPNRKFISFMTEQECDAINFFIISNNLQRGARLHDAILFIDDKTKPQILTIKPNVDFGFKELNRPVIKEHFRFGAKHLPYAYIGSVPQGLNLISKHENTKPDLIGTANGFNFYAGKFQYINAGFNMNNPKTYLTNVVNGQINGNGFVLIENANEHFIYNLKNMLDTFFYLNKRKLKPLELELILKHIRKYSNYIFNVRATYLKLIKYNPIAQCEIKARDFEITKELKFKTKLDFLKAMNEAKKCINIDTNYKDLIDLMHERITNNDYGFMNENKIIGHKRNNLLVFALVKLFNLLCNGSYYKPRKPKVCNLFINTNIKRLQTFEMVEQNKERTHQLYYLLCKVAGAITDLDIIKNDEVQNELKHELIQYILKIKINNIEAGVNCFDFLYKPPPTNKIEFNTDLENSFDTDLSKSIFNQLTLEQAQNKEPKFLKEYLKFHKVSKRKQETYIKQRQKEQFEFTIIKFDE